MIGIMFMYILNLGECGMNKLLIIYAAVIFIFAVVLFTYAELHKNAEQEPETYKWMKVFSFVLLAIAVVCFFGGKG